MRTVFRRYLVGAGAVALLAAPLPAHAQLANMPSSGFAFADSNHGITSPSDGLFLAAAGPAGLRADDDLIIGSSAFSTNTVGGDVSTPLTGDAAWVDRDEFLPGAGDYTIALSLQGAMPGHDDGPGIGIAVAKVTVTPEPASMALLGAGLAGVVGAARRRRAARG